MRMGPLKCYIAQWGGGGVKCPDKMQFEGVLFRVISAMRRWVGVKFPENTVT